MKPTTEPTTDIIGDDLQHGVTPERDRRTAVRDLYRDQFVRMARFAAARLGDAEAGRDLVNDTFVLALRRLDTLREVEALPAWVWSILVNETRRHRRLLRRRRTGPLPDEPDIPAPEVPEIDENLRRHLRRLPERQRTVLFLRYYGDLTNPQIAALLGVTTGTVAATLHHAQAAMRSAMEGDSDV